MPESAMILAAGLGTRMRPITDTIPKPLVEVGGRAMIDYAIDALVAEGVDNIVVNVHYLGDQLIEHLSNRSDCTVVISDERAELMNSGGGIVKALPLLGAEPFYLLNADTFWLEDPDQPANLASLARDWDGARMDLLLMTVTLGRFIGHNGKLDFNRDDAGRLTRFDARAPNAVIYPGVAIVDPQIFHGRAAEPFSLNLCFDQAIAGKRLFASAAHGLWLTVGTPQAISEAETAMREYQSSSVSKATVLS
tara:strand:+ start:118649 stop:119398 length:750 start_codon:yes stop_codon:yes gene_type:complete